MEEIISKYQKQIQAIYSKEFITVISILRNDTENISIDGKFNWQKFLEIISYHKLAPFLFLNNLLEDKLFSDGVKQQLKKKYEEKSKINLHITSHLLKLNDLFDEHEIERIWLKGPVLAMDLYQYLNQRLSGDLDVLVDEKDILNVNLLLKNNGYKCKLDLEKLKHAARRFFLMNTNQLHYYNSTEHVAVELHWRLLNPNGLWRIDFEELFRNSREVKVGNKNLKTLNNVHNFLFLAVHGSSHQWFRLFWLRDIHEIFSQNKLNWNEIIELAIKNKLKNILLETCYISNLFFNTPVPKILADLKCNYKVLRLIKKIIKAINQPIEIFRSRKLRYLKYIFYLSQLKNDYRYKLNCFKMLFIKPEELNNFNYLNIPNFLFPLYFIIRPFSWFYEQYIKKF